MTLQAAEMRVGGISRHYWIAPAPTAVAPLIVVFHGLGISPQVMARWTGLDERGPAAGFATVFPEGLGETWDDTGLGRRDGAEDGAFISTLVDQLIANRTARADAIFLVGLSNGASFAEHLARFDVVNASAIALISGSARQESRERSVRPRQQTALLMIAGTADPVLPWSGGFAAGIPGWISRRRRRRLLQSSGDRGSVAPLTVCTDWAAVNGCSPTPTQEELPKNGADTLVERLSWRCSNSVPVVLYRVLGGGHGWPGNRWSGPRFIFGRVPRRFDASGIVLDFCLGQV